MRQRVRGGTGRGSPPELFPESVPPDAAPPPEAGRGRSSPLGQIVRTAARTVKLLTLGFLTLLAFCVLYDDLIGDGPIPIPRSLRKHHPELQLLTQRNTTLGVFGGFEPSKEYWGDLAPTRTLLAAIAPEVDDWLQQQYRAGKVRLAAEPDYQATWDFFTGTLTLHRGFFAESDGMKVAQIMHEYRHSRQSWCKFVRLSVSHMFYREGRHEIIEQDAHVYEIMALDALGMADQFDEPAAFFGTGLNAYARAGQSRPTPPAMLVVARVARR